MNKIEFKQTPIINNVIDQTTKTLISNFVFLKMLKLNEISKNLKLNTPTGKFDYSTYEIHPRIDRIPNDIVFVMWNL